MRFNLVALILSLTLSGCAEFGPAEVTPPNAVTVTQAFTDVGEGLTAFRQKVDVVDTNGKETSLGLITCRIIVHFNISASANSKGGTSATLAVPIQAVKLSGSASESEEADAARSNSVLIDLASINPQICAWYENPSDMYPSNSSTQGEIVTSASDTTGGNPANGTTTGADSTGNSSTGTGTMSGTTGHGSTGGQTSGTTSSQGANKGSSVTPRQPPTCPPPLAAGSGQTVMSVETSSCAQMQ